MPPPDDQVDPVNRIFHQIVTILLKAWRETGYGQLTIDSERINQKKIRVVIRGSTHYSYVISDEDVGRIGEAMRFRFPQE